MMLNTALMMTSKGALLVIFGILLFNNLGVFVGSGGLLNNNKRLTRITSV